MLRDLLACASAAFVVMLIAPAHRLAEAQQADSTSEDVVRARIEMLASDALQGRASLSRDSWVAASYLASELRRMGIEPAGDNGGFLQSFAGPPRRAASAAPSDATVPERRGWNVVGRIPGADANESGVIMLGAHLDHIGVSGTGPDRINNGADDNASGVTAVLGIAEGLAAHPRARRSVYLIFFDGEEIGGAGASYLLEHPPVPLDQITALICFEMLGRPDLRLAPGTLWLTGYDRSTLGAELARWGARIVPDPYPKQQFFERSDNAVFAYRGIIAQTISSFGLHADYHRPTDDASAIDIAHLTGAIRMLAPHMRRLADSTFEPAWLPGRRPQRASAPSR
jgi:hypothetical protein